MDFNFDKIENIGSRNVTISNMKGIGKLYGKEINLKTLMEKYEEIIPAIVNSGLQKNTKKTYFQSIYRLLTLNNVDKSIINKYNNFYLIQYRDHKVDKKLLPAYNKIKKAVMEMNTNDFSQQDILIASLYVLRAPLRASDYLNCKIYNKKPKSKDHNYFVFSKSETVTFYDNVHKTSNGNYNPRIVFRGITKWNLVKWVKPNTENQRDILFDDPLNNQANFSKHVPKIFKKLVNYELTITDLRKIFETYLMKTPAYKRLDSVEQAKLHQKLFHTKSTAENYYKMDK